MGQHGWTLWALCQVKEDKPKRQHIVWFHLYGMSRTGKSAATWHRLVGCLVLDTRDREWLLMGMGDDKCSKLRLLYNCESAKIHWIMHFNWLNCMYQCRFFLKEIKILISRRKEYMQGWSPVGVWNLGDRAGPKGNIWNSAWGVGEAVGVNRVPRESMGCK